MDADERDICIYLKSLPGQFVSGREICRRAAGKKRYHHEPEWAIPVLGRLIEKGVIESDSTGHYRLIAKQREKKHGKWVSPQIKRILEKSGKDFSQVINIESDDLEN